MSSNMAVDSTVQELGQEPGEQGEHHEFVSPVLHGVHIAVQRSNK